MPLHSSLATKRFWGSIALSALLCLPALAQAQEVEIDTDDDAPVTIAPRSDILVSESEAPHMILIGVNDAAREESWAFSEPERVLSPLDSNQINKLHSQTLRALLTNILSKPADIDIWREEQKDSWHHKRMKLLLELEAYDSVKALQHATPMSLQDEAWKQREHDLAFSRYDDDKICDDLDIFPSIDRDNSIYWPLYCHIHNQDYEKASLASELLQEQSKPSPVWLEALIARQNLEDPTDKNQTDALPAWPTAPLSATTLYMMHDAEKLADALQPSHWPVEHDTLSQAPLWVSTHPALPPHARLDALAHALSKGYDVSEQWNSKFKEAALHEDIQTLLVAQEEEASKDAHWSIADMMRYYKNIHQQYTVNDTVQAYMEMMTNLPSETHGMVSDLFAEDVTSLSHAIFRKHAMAHFAPTISTMFLLNNQWGDAKPWLNLAQKSLSPSSTSIVALYSDALFDLKNHIENKRFESALSIKAPATNIDTSSNADHAFMKDRLDAIFGAYTPIEADLPPPTQMDKSPEFNSTEYWQQQLLEAGEDMQYAELVLLSSHILAEKHGNIPHDIWRTIIRAFILSQDFDTAWALTQEAIRDALLHTGR